MPKKNGIETSKEILKIDKSVKIIFTSADRVKGNYSKGSNFIVLIPEVS